MPPLAVQPSFGHFFTRVNNAWIRGYESVKGGEPPLSNVVVVSITGGASDYQVTATVILYSFFIVLCFETRNFLDTESFLVVLSGSVSNGIAGWDCASVTWAHSWHSGNGEHLDVYGTPEHSVVQPDGGSGVSNALFLPVILINASSNSGGSKSSPVLTVCLVFGRTGGSYITPIDRQEHRPTVH